MSLQLRNYVLMAVMVFAATAGLVLRPTHHVASDGPKLDLEVVIPQQFGEWKSVKLGAQIINPLQQETLSRIYTQTLMRTYVNPDGQAIMLSIAYGQDQSDAKQLHYPEVCYPAQGFQVISNVPGEVKTAQGSIRVKRLVTAMGNRVEPLTYWSTVGSKVVRGNKETKLEQLHFGFRGEIPDGLLFRVSSISPEADAEFALQDKFINALVKELPAPTRLRIAGLGG